MTRRFIAFGLAALLLAALLFLALDDAGSEYSGNLGPMVDGL